MFSKKLSKLVRTRFAPSPTGYLHIGNARSMLINYLYARKYNGEFILRIDNTDLVRSKKIYEDAIIEDMKWMGVDFDKKFDQISRLDLYEKAKEKLIASGRLYPCFETKDELELKRKLLLSRGKPPIYDRASLKLSKEKQEQYILDGRAPHYRFKLKEGEISFDDMIKGQIKFNAAELSDPVLIRNDGSFTYMLCSTIDDIDYDITHVIRGEDHITNTAIQIQLFEALGADFPLFGHLGLIKSNDDKISKRAGGFDIKSLKEDHLENMSVNSLLTIIGSRCELKPYDSIQKLIDLFDIKNYTKSNCNYERAQLDQLNHKIISNYDLSSIKNSLIKNNMIEIADHIDDKFWSGISGNVDNICDVKKWYELCQSVEIVKTKNPELIKVAIKYLPEEIKKENWKIWMNLISKTTGLKGKNLFMPIRIALTAREDGPEMSVLFSLLTRDEIVKRLTNVI